MKVLLKNQQRLIKVKPQRIKGYLNKALHLLDLDNAEVSVLFVNDRRMRALNYQYRGIDRTTDVLSFPQYTAEVKKRKSPKVEKSKLPNFRTSELLNSGGNLLLGDIVINLHAAKRQAPEHRLSFMGELEWLLMHGLLHLIGYDHEAGVHAERKMRRKEAELLRKLQERQQACH